MLMNDSIYYYSCKAAAYIGKLKVYSNYSFSRYSINENTEVMKYVKSEIGEDKVICTPVNVGNPHAVIFITDTENAPVAVLGPQIEKHSMFPGGVNVEFVQVISDRKLRMRVWERGSGITMACGTGACASAAAAVRKGFCRSGEPITVVLDGGELKITVASEDCISMCGPAEFVYEGEISV